MSGDEALLDELSASDPAVRLGARRTLEARLRQSERPIAYGLRLAERVENERQARVLGALLSGATTERELPGLLLGTTLEDGWRSSVARRAVRHWLENAAPLDAAEGLHRCLVVAAELDNARIAEFICDVMVKVVLARPAPVFGRLIPVLEAIVSQRRRGGLSWLSGPGVAPVMPYEPALEELRVLLPETDLPLPAEAAPEAESLPRPASGALENAETLPIPTPEPQGFWERLTGYRGSRGHRQG